MNRRRWLLVVAILAIVLLAILGPNRRPGPGSTATGHPTGQPTGQPTVSPAVSSPVSPPRSASLAAGSLATLLDLLPVQAEERTGYDRSFFVHWIDTDGDGCDTRREVLIEEAVVAPIVGNDCRLSGGRWHSLYDDIETTTPGDFDIDHLVPLAEAWDSGASGWTEARRTAFANDLGVPWSLIAVTATSNRAKSDGDPADWQPPLVSVQCRYAADWIAVKVRWALAIDPIERAVLASYSTTCPDTRSIVLAP
ncbi:MAG: hypothetical protein HW391_455 [Chloroflexi bacterium]|nr:hypothetical protein [Chloroflexota bacterium]